MSFRFTTMLVSDLVRVAADGVADPASTRRVLRVPLGVVAPYWVVDEAAGEYLFRIPGLYREESAWLYYMLFTHGRLIEISVVGMSSHQASFQRFPASLESSRDRIRQPFSAANQVYGRHGKGPNGSTVDLKPRSDSRDLVQPEFIQDDLVAPSM